MIIDPVEFRRLAISLASNQCIPIFGEINAQLEEIVIESIFKFRSGGDKKVTLLINSGGGFDYCYTGIKAAMLESGIAFRGLVMSRAHSNGFRILQDCDSRVAVSDATLMFHWGGARLGNSELAALMAGETWPTEAVINTQLLVLRQAIARTGLSEEDLRRFALYERYFSAEEALKFNMIDEIIPDLPARIKADLRSSS